MCFWAQFCRKFLNQCLLLLLLLSHFSRVQLCATPQTTAWWDSPGKNTGVGCHFLLQCMKEKSESEVAQSCLTLSDPMDCSLLGSSIHGIFQARVLEWGAIAFSRISVYSYWIPFSATVAMNILNFLLYFVKKLCTTLIHLQRSNHPHIPGIMLNLAYLFCVTSCQFP